MSSLWQGGEHITNNGKEMVNGIGGANPGTVGTMFFGTISGGAGAAISGGNFWQGAVTGLVVSGLNHVAHSGNNKTKFSTSEEEGVTPDGEITFKGLTKEQLNDFKLIPEDAIQNQELQSPQSNNTVYKVDGVYCKQFSDNKYWYKVGNGSSATVSVNKSGNYIFRNTTSSFNPLKYFSVVGFQSKSNDHWYRPTVNSPNGNPFDLNNFKK